MCDAGPVLGRRRASTESMYGLLTPAENKKHDSVLIKTLETENPTRATVYLKIKKPRKRPDIKRTKRTK